MNEMLNRLLNTRSFLGDRPLSVGLVALSLVLFTLLIYFIFSRILLGVSRKSPENLIGIAWKKFRYPLLALILLLDLIILQSLFTPGQEIPDFLGHIFTIALIFVFTWLLIKSIHLARGLILRRYDISEKDNLKARKSIHTIKGA